MRAVQNKALPKWVSSPNSISNTAVAENVVALMTGMVREIRVWLRMNNKESTGGLKEDRERTHRRERESYNKSSKSYNEQYVKHKYRHKSYANTSLCTSPSYFLQAYTQPPSLFRA